MKLTTEVVTYNIEAAVNAQRGGADRVEVCDNAGGGGTTPSFGTVKVLREVLDIDLFVMIRPRAGDFCYSDLEFKVMKDDIKQYKKLGVDGVVFGILLPNGDIDKERCKELNDLAGSLQTTCHRAFDMTRSAVNALEECINAGFNRILTSGQKAQARQGVPLIKNLVAKAENRISIMAGCGVNEDTVESIVTMTGIDEIHLSAAASRDSVMEYKNRSISGMGSTSDREYLIDTVSPNRVKKIRQIAIEALSESL